MEQNSNQTPKSLDEQHNTSQSQKTTNTKVLIATMCFFIIAVLGLIAYVFWSKAQNTEVVTSPIPTASTQNDVEQNLNSQNSFVPEVENKIFIATRDSDGWIITLFDPVKKAIVSSKKITPYAALSSRNKTGSYGANDSVQFNPKTQEIFFSTQGHSDFDGSCINKDGTCVSRFYKIGFNQQEPVILFESSSPPMNWIVNTFDNSLLLSLREDDKQILKKISGENGKEIFTKEYQVKEHAGFTDFVLSRDGKFTYQASKESLDGKWFYEILRLRKIDNTSGDVSEQEIFGGAAIEYETNLSPNDDFIAFFSGVRGSTKLYVYQISTKKLTNIAYQGSIGNYNLVWSGDSKKLLYLLNNSMFYYDLESSKNVLVEEDFQQTPYVYGWSPTINYFAYKSVGNGIKIFEIQNKQVIDTGLNEELGIGGISWY